MTADEQAVLDRHAQECDSLFKELQARLGEYFYAGHGGTEFMLTSKGRSVIRCGPTTYFRHEQTGKPVAGRTRGGRAEFAIVEPNGRLVWTMAPVGDPARN